MAYGDFEDLNRRTASDKILHNKAFNVAKNPKCHKCYDKKTSGGAIKNEIMTNKELPENLYKPIIRKFKKQKVYSFFIDNIWGADHADLQLISKFNK